MDNYSKSGNQGTIQFRVDGKPHEIMKSEHLPEQDSIP